MTRLSSTFLPFSLPRRYRVYRPSCSLIILARPGAMGWTSTHFPFRVSLLVGQVEPVVNESTQEVALAKLQDLLGSILQDISVITGLFQNFVIQSFHIAFSLSLLCCDVRLAHILLFIIVDIFRVPSSKIPGKACIFCKLFFIYLFLAFCTGKHCIFGVVLTCIAQFLQLVELL